MKKHIVSLLTCSAFFTMTPAFCMVPSEDQKQNLPKPAPSCGKVVLLEPTEKDKSTLGLCPLEVKWGVFKNLSSRDIEAMFCVSKHYSQFLEPLVSRVNFDLEATLPHDEKWKIFLDHKKLAVPTAEEQSILGHSPLEVKWDILKKLSPRDSESMMCVSKHYYQTLGQVISRENFTFSLYHKMPGVPTLLQTFTIFQTMNKTRGNAYFIPQSEKLEFFIKVGLQDGPGVNCSKNWNFSDMSFCPIYIKKDNEETAQAFEKYNLNYKLDIWSTPHFGPNDSHPHSDLHPHERFLSKAPLVTSFAPSCILLWNLEKKLSVVELVQKHTKEIRNIYQDTKNFGFKIDIPWLARNFHMPEAVIMEILAQEESPQT